MSKDRVLGQDYIILKGRGERDRYNGATVKDDNYVHLGLLLESRTACNKAIDKALLTDGDVEINCPECIKDVKKRITEKGGL
ncbi:unnamed protein product [marine sediment metagenome]|uniref:Uncharacterized protein n=1 Tax=marine sediment metagenome TaxID=412755 RepID=X1MTD7_9ZZZZ